MWRLFAAAVVPLVLASPPVLVLYDTDATVGPNTALDHLIRRSPFKTLLVGQGEPWRGWGGKYAAVIPALRSLPSDTLVVVSDSRDVLANMPEQNADASLKAAFASVARHVDTVVFSAEAQCCVSALTHLTPGTLYHNNGTRAERSCMSGETECNYIHNGALPWMFRMESAAKNSFVKGDDVYLNAGLHAGTASALLKLYDCASVENNEDDQAVFTDIFLHKPSTCPIIALDYERVLFANARWPQGMPLGCPFSLGVSSNRIETDTQTVPFFLHFSNKFNECMDLVGSLQGYTIARSQEDAESGSDIPSAHRKRRLFQYGLGGGGKNVAKNQAGKAVAGGVAGTGFVPGGHSLNAGNAGGGNTQSKAVNAKGAKVAKAVAAMPESKMTTESKAKVAEVAKKAKEEKDAKKKKALLAGILAPVGALALGGAGVFYARKRRTHTPRPQHNDVQMASPPVLRV